MSVIEDRPTLGERYSTALAHGTTKPEVVAAFGIAGKAEVTGADGIKRAGSPLGAALHRLMAGDDHAAQGAIECLADMAWSYAAEIELKPKLRRLESLSVAAAVLAWYQDGTCKPCHGLGQHVIQGTTTLHHICTECHGAGRKPFGRIFTADRVDIARWLQGKIESEQGRAAALARDALG